MAIFASVSSAAYSTTTGVPTPNEKHAGAIAAIAKMHEAADHFTPGELRAMAASEEAWRQSHCEIDDYQGGICNGLLLHGLCTQSYLHLM